MKDLCIPQNDIDCYYNRQWKQNQTYLRNKNIDNFVFVQKEIDNNIFELIKNIDVHKNSVNSNLIKFINSYFNKSNSSEIIIQLINMIKQVEDFESLSHVIKKLNNMGIMTLFNLGIIPHHQEPNEYTIYLDETELTLDKESYSINKQIRQFKHALGEIYNFIKKEWNYDYSDRNNFISNIVTFEIFISKIILNNEDKSNPLIISNSFQLSEFLKKWKTSFWEIIFSDFSPKIWITYTNEKYIDYISSLLELAFKDRINYLNMIKDYIFYNLVKYFGIYTKIGKILSDLNVNKYDETKIFTNLLYNTFGHHIESLFEEKYHDVEREKQIVNMFRKIKNYCIYVFKKMTMFSEGTKKEALKKLEVLDIIVGRDKYRVDLSLISNINNDFYCNLITIDSFLMNESFKLVGKKIDRTYISINHDVFSFIINAYYNPHINMIYIPLGLICTNIFYDKEADPIYNYGGLGSILGHEIMHSFDNHGSLFDHFGHIKNWWIEEDHNKYIIEINNVYQHYSHIKLNGKLLNAKLSMGENIADITGIKISLRTFLHNYVGKMKGFDCVEKKYLSKFFERWATIFRAVIDKDHLLTMMEADVHAPNSIRINASLSHISEYYEIFNVQSKHQNYLDPKLRTHFMDE
uniref:Peptidase M13 C-terminal domain-containing protein n=1 Tax=viral metagenome TaxID=1070528 RepID=A0A6C0LRQ8_9ZZZZ